MLDLKPKIKVMTNEQIEKVHQDALSILEGTGVVVDDPVARQVFEKAVGRTSADRCIRIPKDLVNWAIKVAPSDFPIYDRLGNKSFDLKGDGSQDAVFGIGVTNLNYQDPIDNVIKPFHRHHMAAAAGLGQRLDNFHFISTPGIIQDLPPETADLYGVLELLANSTQPLTMLISDWSLFHPFFFLGEQLCGILTLRLFIIL